MNAREALAIFGKPKTPKEAGELAAAAKIAGAFSEKAIELVRKMLMDGERADGFKLGKGRAIRTIADVPGAFAKLRDAGLEAEALSAASLSYSKLPENCTEIIYSHITTKTSEPSLVVDKSGGEK